ncbi:MAG: hypothetical protein E5Y73_17185 [Mesorhizobium sp.]|uniref:hypothetical protein n=1 Tax=Mesorhizobium sp. TaxID=1871066 RepID=UPI001219D620|nr:hypothetical protein [Mesorhizobium sp.]TIL91411.1 MAG: hypothetical protein E5Y73_17185 [Mesorhizobium sp.]
MSELGNMLAGPLDAAGLELAIDAFDEWGDVTGPNQRHYFMAKAISAYLAALGTHPVPVAVKGLEWKESHYRHNSFVAPTGFGENYVAYKTDEGWRCVGSDHATLDAAKAAAQADYDARIRSALAPATQAVPGDVVEALRFYADKKNWMAGRWPEDPDELVEDLICIDWQHEEGGSIPFADCGDRARNALAGQVSLSASGRQG